MERRHTEIREGAGLEESRINREFIDFLQQWGGWILIVLAVIALGYAGLEKLENMRRNSRDNAFLALNAALESQNPEGLLRVAEEHDVGVVPKMARREAADIWLACAKVGLTPGDLYEVTSTGNWDGVIPETSKDFDPDAALKQAESLYEALVEESRGDKKHAEFTLSGLFGLAAVAEARADKDAAAKYYQEAKKVADDAGMTDIAMEAQERLDTLDAVQVASLPPADSLYQPEPETPEIAAPPMTPADPSAAPVAPEGQPAPADTTAPDEAAPPPAPDENAPADDAPPPPEAGAPPADDAAPQEPASTP